MINRKRFTSFFKSQKSTFPPETVLTYDTWSDYLYAVADKKYSKDWNDGQIEHEFRSIESSEEITRNFFAIPEQSRQTLIHLSHFRFSHAEIIAYTNIFHKLHQLYPKIDTYRLLFNRDSYDGRKGYEPKFSYDFVDYVYKFVNFQRSMSNDVMWAWGKVSGSLIYVLVPVYGERRIMEVIDLWVTNASSANRLEDFITLIDRFDDLDTSYPLSWLLGVLTSDICTKLQMSSNHNLEH